MHYLLDNRKTTQNADSPATPLAAIFNLTLSTNPTPYGTKVPHILVDVKLVNIDINDRADNLGCQP